ncbi:hypothetical protein GCM10017567_52870 [Amycolatopsis bullii]|uniref:Uncharacterized protein n=1 Tax=Amycolatopsis bullii TaxID=941987 RepID=A0ABQ3KJ16_9PSEU|nr:hypothetical protein GCM10017567_52870 [Amycolatopsis bullii]
MLIRNSRSDPEISRRHILGLMINKYPRRVAVNRRRGNGPVTFTRGSGAPPG